MRSVRDVPWVLGGVAWLATAVALGCGGDDQPANPDATAAPDAATAVDADDRDLLIRLNGLPGVTAVEETDPADPSVRLFDLMITQPVDHDVTGGQTFAQNVTLVHRGFDRPMIATTTGYWNYQGYSEAELTRMLTANQIAIEHRFFYRSRPDPADWTKLTIAQSAADEHHIVELLKPIYPMAWVTTGASKGGMTASYHRRFYPDDVAASVPYVAPLSFAAGDTRYAAFLDTIGPPACRQALRDLEVELLKPARFDAILAQATTQAQQDSLSYTRIAIGPAVESAITGIEWAFWQYAGVGFCPQVPAVTASDAAMWGFLEQVSSVSGSSDAWVDAFDAYYYQASFELGYPDGGGAFLAGLTRYTADDYAGMSPLGVAPPVYTPAPMMDVDQWVESSGARLLFLYGGWDPWTGGKYELGSASDSLRVIAPQLTHGASLLDLVPTDKTAAFAKIAAWTGVQPDESLAKPAGRGAGRRLAQVREPRIPPAIVRALQLRR